MVLGMYLLKSYKNLGSDADATLAEVSVIFQAATQTSTALKFKRDIA